jgi:HSP20 family protein
LQAIVTIAAVPCASAARCKSKETVMANITRYDPFNELDDVFKGLFVRPMRFDLDLAPQMKMKIDVTKADDTYSVKADIPGVKKDDIQVSVDGNEVTISGEIKKETEEKKGEEVLRSERYYGKISRSFTLPHAVDESKVTAKYADGVLKLTLPMKTASKSKKITVS